MVISFRPWQVLLTIIETAFDEELLTADSVWGGSVFVGRVLWYELVQGHSIPLWSTWFQRNQAGFLHSSRPSMQRSRSVDASRPDWTDEVCSQFAWHPPRTSHNCSSYRVSPLFRCWVWPCQEWIHHSYSNYVYPCNPATSVPPWAWARGTLPSRAHSAWLACSWIGCSSWWDRIAWPTCSPGWGRWSGVGGIGGWCFTLRIRKGPNYIWIK
jgi:hypothetical protein